MAGKRTKKALAEDSRYHDTWRLLKKYRDVVWSMELSVQQVKKEFEIEFGSTIDDFLESVYLAGADLGGTRIENHARCIERSNQMLKLLNNAVDILRTRHKSGETYYWLLYYTFLSPQQLDNVNEIIEQLHPLGVFLQGLYGAVGRLFPRFGDFSLSVPQSEINRRGSPEREPLAVRTYKK